MPAPKKFPPDASETQETAATGDSEEPSETEASTGASTGGTSTASSGLADWMKRRGK
jgi:hypothetical protein